MTKKNAVILVALAEQWYGGVLGGRRAAERDSGIMSGDRLLWPCGAPSA